MSYKNWNKVLKQKLLTPKSQNATSSKFILATNWTGFFTPSDGSKAFNPKFSKRKFIIVIMSYKNKKVI